jgi:hypothetical protein
MHARRGRLVSLLTAAILVVSVLTLSACVSRESQPFESAAWKRGGTIAMAYDIQSRNLLKSMNVEQVVSLLGRPDAYMSSPGLLEPSAGSSGSGVLAYPLERSWSLQVTFADGKVLFSDVVEP